MDMEPTTTTTTATATENVATVATAVATTAVTAEHEHPHPVEDHPPPPAEVLPPPLPSPIPRELLPEEPVFDGVEKPEPSHPPEQNTSLSESDRAEEGKLLMAWRNAHWPETASALKSYGAHWPEKASAFRNYVRESSIAVSNTFRKLKEDIERIATEQPDPNAERKPWLPLTLRFLRDSEHADNANANSAATDSHARDAVEKGPKMKGRIMFFSISGCPDCKEVRALFRRKALPFIEVNVDVFPQRRIELEERTGTASVPQIFLNANFIGGIDELKALESTGELNEKLKEVFEQECPASAPLPPVYGEDDPQSEKLDEFAEIVQKLRTKVQIKDRFYKMRMFSSCFTGSEAVDVLAEELCCEREEAVEYGRKLASKHFFRHVLQENIFEDGSHLYRYFEHDPVISTRCLNFTGATNDLEIKPATELAITLRKLTLAIFESYVLDDGKHVDYYGISQSEEFRRYLKAAEDLHRISLHGLTREQMMAFFINMYNMMVIHVIVVYGYPTGPLERRNFFGDLQYVVGGYPYSLSAIQNGILRGNQRPPYNLIKPFGPKDTRLPMALPYPEPLVHFALCHGSQSSPIIRCYSPSAIDSELRSAAKAFLQDGGIQIDSELKTIFLSRVFQWYSVDFGKNEVEILRWTISYLEPNRVEELLQILDGGQFKVVYQPYDWTPNFAF